MKMLWRHVYFTPSFLWGNNEYTRGFAEEEDLGERQGFVFVTSVSRGGRGGRSTDAIAIRHCLSELWDYITAVKGTLELCDRRIVTSGRCAAGLRLRGYETPLRCACLLAARSRRLRADKRLGSVVIQHPRHPSHAQRCTTRSLLIVE